MNWVAVKRNLCVYMEVTDEQWERIANDPEFYVDMEFNKECTDAKGDNAVLTLLMASGDWKLIWRELGKLKKKYKRVGFWNRGHKKFYQTGVKYACANS